MAGSIFCVAHESMIVPWRKAFVDLLQPEGTWRLSNGFVTTGARGMPRLLLPPRRMGTWVLSSGHCRTVAPGARRRVVKLRDGCSVVGPGNQTYFWESGTCRQTGQGRHLHVLQLARRNSFHWRSTTCAAPRGPPLGPRGWLPVEQVNL
ncbi:unnamed protein product [Scytosiphon promiscuus]